ncbi:MAG: glycosyltransferase [Patescibacteria group bacterium]|nr:glycosyltransferase [Patescibacteria group bacterium]
MKIALVHDFLTQYGGAERVLDAFLELFPKAPIYTLVYDKEKMGKYYGKYDVRPSFLQNSPGGIKKYKWYLPLMPKAIESFDLSNFDVVLSDSSAYAKGVITKKPTIHICYLHTPTRYLWSDTESYLKTAPIPKIIRPIMPLTIKYLRQWDLKASKRPDFYIVNSKNINDRLKKYYHRVADEIIWPPVDCDKFKFSHKICNFFLVVSRMEPYKKIDLVVDAFNKLKLPLKIVGTGTNAQELKNKAAKNIEFVGRVPDQELIKYMSSAQALIFPQNEDAGITPLEAMASGRPVIAYRAGGALEIVKPGENGEFFDFQTQESIIKVIKKFDYKKYNSEYIRKFAQDFCKDKFKEKIKQFIERKAYGV